MSAQHTPGPLTLPGYQVDGLYTAQAADGTTFMCRQREGVEALADVFAAADAVAEFIGGAKDRLGRPDPAANDDMRAARERVRELAVKYRVTGQDRHTFTYLDQCAAVLRAAIAKATGSQP
jgi:hypothetical protein